MTKKQIREVIKNYLELLNDLGIVQKKFPSEQTLLDLEKGLNHVHYMLNEIVAFVEEGRTDKAFGWLDLPKTFCG